MCRLVPDGITCAGGEKEELGRPNQIFLAIGAAAPQPEDQRSTHEMKRIFTAWSMAGAGLGFSLFAWFASWFVQQFYHRTPHLFWNGVPELCFLFGALLGLIGLFLRKPQELGVRTAAELLCGFSLVFGLYGCGALAPPPTVPPRPHSKETRERFRCIHNLYAIQYGKEGIQEQRGSNSVAEITMQEIVTYVQSADSNFPQCVSGGEYIVNPPGSNPVCTVHGNLLKVWE